MGPKPLFFFFFFCIKGFLALCSIMRFPFSDWPSGILHVLMCCCFRAHYIIRISGRSHFPTVLLMLRQLWTKASMYQYSVLYPLIYEPCIKVKTVVFRVVRVGVFFFFFFLASWEKSSKGKFTWRCVTINWTLPAGQQSSTPKGLKRN